MRFSASSINKTKTTSENNIVKGIIPNNFKKFNPNISDEFDNILNWQEIRGTWTTTAGKVSTSTAASSYPIISNFDLRSQDISATMSLDSAGPGVVFWLVDSDNWWAGVTYYTAAINAEQYISSYFTYSVGNPICYGWDGARQWGCSRGVSQANYAYRTRYNFYIKLIKSENGVISDVTNILLRSTCSVSTAWSPCTASSADNINGVQIVTSGDTITVRGRDNANNFYGSAISYTATSPNKGYRSGVVYTPGSTYLLSSNVDNISIIGS
jgi:hypothetical protein